MQCVILIGAPASGKSTFYRRRFYRTHLRINLDMLRTRHREKCFVELCLQTRQAFVVDNTNPTPADRARYLGAAKAAGFRTAGYYFDCSCLDCLERNARRPGSERIPDRAVQAIHRRLVTPDPGEGFDELFRVTVNGQGDFAVAPWAAPVKPASNGP